jgi:eukaryotic-like serine/threonine-protein kinase
MPDLSGQDIGQYHIVERLGEGGMATVYKAYDTRLDCEVAIKFIRRDAVPAEMHQHMFLRFEREAKEMAKLSYPNIVHVRNYGEFEGSPYLVMEYIRGGTLKSKTGKAMPYAEAARTLAPIARSLEYAHARGLVHRDVKPANILLSEDGIPMLSDFGIAKILEQEPGQTLTGTGMGVGTPEYMAPEQWLGKACEASDIYSLGIVFFELVTGRKPYTADTPNAIMLKHITDPLPRPRQFKADLPEEVEHVVFTALAKATGSRYSSMGEFAAALERLGHIEEERYIRAEIEKRIKQEMEEKIRGEMEEKYQRKMEQAKSVEPAPIIQPDIISAPMKDDNDNAERPEEEQYHPKMEQAKPVEPTPTITYDILSGPMKKDNGSVERREDGDKSSTISPSTRGMVHRASSKWFWLLAGFIVFLIIFLPWANRLAVASMAQATQASLIVAQGGSQTFPYTDTPQPLTATPKATIALTITPTRTRFINTSVELEPGATLLSDKDGMILVYVPAGEFLMGSTDEQISAAMQDCVAYGNSQNDCETSLGAESPQHTVYLDGFWIDRSEITNTMYEKCVVVGVCDPPYSTSSYSRTSYYGNSQYADYPVIQRDWNMANAYCDWAGRRLPSEAEWEKAARGTDGRLYPWGDQAPASNLLNYNLIVSDTTKVGSYPSGASPYGALDMAGNVWEWVNDWYDENYYANSPLENPHGPSSGSFHGLRGGSWNDGSRLVRSVFRCGNNPNCISDNFGFRCALSAAP